MSSQIRVELLLDEDVLEWIDCLNKKLGLRSRSWLVNKLLLEVRGEEENENLDEEDV